MSEEIQQNQQVQIMLHDMLPLISGDCNTTELREIIEDLQPNIQQQQPKQTIVSKDQQILEEGGFITKEKFNIQDEDELSVFELDVQNRDTQEQKQQNSLQPIIIPEQSFDRKAEPIIIPPDENKPQVIIPNQLSPKQSPLPIVNKQTSNLNNKIEENILEDPFAQIEDNKFSYKFTNPKNLDDSIDDLISGVQKMNLQTDTKVVSKLDTSMQQKSIAENVQNINNLPIVTSDGYVIENQQIQSLSNTKQHVLTSYKESTPMKIIIIKDIMKLQGILEDLHTERYFDESQLHQYDFKDLVQTKQLLQEKVNELEQGWFLENIILAATDTTSVIFNGKRKIFGMQPNLQGLSIVVGNKLRSRKHILAEKSKKIQDRIGEDKLLALEIVIAAVQHGYKKKNQKSLI